MSKSVSNDALWEKLSDIEEKINRYLKIQETAASIQEQVNISPELKANKDEIIDIFKRCIQGLGTHCDSHFKTIYKNTSAQDEIIRKVWNIAARIRRQQRESAELQKDGRETCFNFKIFKARKTSFVIVLLALLVFILTLFCMKQQNDYSLLMDEYYHQSVIIEQFKVEMDNINNTSKERIDKKKK